MANPEPSQLDRFHEQRNRAIDETFAEWESCNERRAQLRRALKDLGVSIHNSTVRFPHGHPRAAENPA